MMVMIMMSKILVKRENSHSYIEDSLAALPVTRDVNKDLEPTIQGKDVDFGLKVKAKTKD